MSAPFPGFERPTSLNRIGDRFLNFLLRMSRSSDGNPSCWHLSTPWSAPTGYAAGCDGA